MDYQIVFSSEARRDLREIKHYISFDSPQIARRFGQRLLAKTDMLQSHPEMGPVFSAISTRVIREIIVGNYRIIYKVHHRKKEIIILRYWHAARGTPHLQT